MSAISSVEITWHHSFGQRKEMCLLCFFHQGHTSTATAAASYHHACWSFLCWLLVLLIGDRVSFIMTK